MPSASLTDNSATTAAAAMLSLYQLLDPEILANPYPFYERLRREDPVHWDPYLHVWVATRYDDVVRVLHDFSAARTPAPDQLKALGLERLSPIAQVMVKVMLFMDGRAHTRLRSLCAQAFTPARVEVLRDHIRDIANRLLDGVIAKGEIELLSEFAAPFPSIVTAEFLGVPVSDHPKLKKWSADFAEMLGNLQHNPDREAQMLKTVTDLGNYFGEAIREQRAHPREGLVHFLATAEVDGDRLGEEELVANLVATMAGGQETTMNLICNGMLTLLRHPAAMEELGANPSLMPSAVEELLRFESPSQHTARLAPEDVVLGGKEIHKRQAVYAVMGAANRDPERFPEPDRFDLRRKDNRHVAFGFGAHFCFGAPLARLEAQIAFEALLRRLKNVKLKPGPVVWRNNLGLRGLTALPLTFDPAGA